jgi:superfamily II DNA/RNA helicase
MSEQERVLSGNVDVLIATPGRLIDLFRRGKILLADVKILVIDEADRMLDMGFIPDIEEIVSLLPKIRQTLFFSATMPPEIRKLADKFLMNPKEISVARPATTASTISQFQVMANSRDKRTLLRDLLRSETVTNALIFCNRKRDVDTLQGSLSRHGFSTAALHGDMPQSRRTETLEKFRAGQVAIMVCSDVAARGIDIAGLSHVINFDVPNNPDDYVHRIGRTGRAGKEGRAFTFVTSAEQKQLSAIEQLIGKPISVWRIEGAAEAPSDAALAPVPSEPTRSPKPRRASPRRSRQPEGSRQPEDRQPRLHEPAMIPAASIVHSGGHPFEDHVPAFILRKPANPKARTRL